MKATFATTAAALTLAALTLAGTGCKKIAELFSFKINDSSTFTLPAAPYPPTVPLPVPAFTITSSAQSTYQSYGVSAENVQDVTLDKLTLTTTNPSTQNFNFIKRLSLYIAKADGSNRVLLASLDPVPQNQTTIELNPTGAKADEYLRSAAYQLIPQVEQAAALPQDTEIRIDSRFNVTARVP